MRLLYSIMDAILEHRIAWHRGKAAHLRALAEDYRAQSHHCSTGATEAEHNAAMLEIRRTQLQHRRLLTKTAVIEMQRRLEL